MNLGQSDVLGLGHPADLFIGQDRRRPRLEGAAIAHRPEQDALLVPIPTSQDAAFLELIQQRGIRQAGRFDINRFLEDDHTDVVVVAAFPNIQRVGHGRALN